MNGRRGTCPAKLNLALAVTGLRPDGFHTLRSVFLLLELHDDLEATLAGDPGAGDELVISGDPDVAVADNLVLRAVELLRETIGRPAPALWLKLTKRIPAAAGLGGGSSDAATALDLASGLWGVSLPIDERLALALRLGADVPFFAAAHRAALVDGVGEGLQPLPGPTATAGVLLVSPAGRLSTAEVFAEFDRAAASTSVGVARIDELAAALRAGLDADGLTAVLAESGEANDLWAAAARLSPALVGARAQLSEVLGRPIMLTGSGPTLFALYPSVNAAREAAATLETERNPALEGATVIVTESHQGAQP